CFYDAAMPETGKTPPHGGSGKTGKNAFTHLRSAAAAGCSALFCVPVPSAQNCMEICTRMQADKKFLFAHPRKTVYHDYICYWNEEMRRRRRRNRKKERI
ncbi:MAG: hypothetical protein LUD54_01270, partial [Oscillospiraceae bacterium]|nr:hypothetical protein [Oscillospiraceae bacterium]